MKSLSFRKDLVGVQEELLRFAYKLTTDREEANESTQDRKRSGIMKNHRLSGYRRSGNRSNR